MRDCTDQPNHREIPSPLQALSDVLGGFDPVSRSRPRAVVRLSLFMGLMMVCVPIYAVARLFGRTVGDAFQRTWYRGGWKICNLTVRAVGTPFQGAGVLFVSNHVSYLDIPIIGSITGGRFIAKAEVGSWPVFGFCAKLTDTVFVKRDAREAMAQLKEIGRHLRSGERMVLFPEGTSSDGQRVLPFKSTLFGVALNDDARLAKRAGDAGQGLDPQDEMWVQPVTIAYPRLEDGRRLEGGLQALYAWYGDMELFPHLMSVFSLAGAEVEVIFHEPVRASDFDNRKALAGHCQRAVTQGLALAHGHRLAGRDGALIARPTAVA